IAEAALQIRDVIAELRPPVLDDFGLSEALRWLGERYQKRFNLPLIIHCDDLPERLPDNVETAFYRVAQSALDNAMRHARASEIHLSFQLKPQEVELIVGDNGVGFDPEIVLKSKDYPTWGVKIMRERMLAIGGSLSIKSEKGDGTQVIAVWSLENRA
ncbi:MAG: ATP-binding protein, partial [Anaerolineales bacterium]|nr:ATP-binding protein [Anaerolineales bacterium]